MGLNGRKGGFKFGFGPKRTPGASFVKIGVGPPTALRPSLLQTLLKRGVLIEYCPWLLAFRNSPLPPAAPVSRDIVLPLCTYYLDAKMWLEKVTLEPIEIISYLGK